MSAKVPRRPDSSLGPIEAARRVTVMTSLPHALDAELLLGVARYASLYGNWHLSTPSIEDGWSLAAVDPPEGLIVRLHPTSADRGQRIADLGFTGPTVVIATPDLAEGRPVVYWDGSGIGAAVARYFLDEGHRRFAAVGHAGHATARNRLIAFAETVRAAGCDCGVVEPPDAHDADAWSTLFASLPDPVAVLATSDAVGRLVLRHGEAAGRRVPDSLAVVGGSGDRVVCEMNRPRMSSIQLPTDRVGFEAAALLARMLDGEEPPAEPLLFPSTGVVERESSHRTASEDPEVSLALRIIRERTRRPLPLEDVLRAVPLSRRALELRFKKAVGHTLQKEIWRLHVLRARPLLLETDLSMPEVAERAGFADAQRMYEVFRRETGQSPSAFRAGRG